MRKKKAEEHENHERWLVSYADFITLLFAFFVVMYAISSVNEGKYRTLSNSLVDAFKNSPASASALRLEMESPGRPAPSDVTEPCPQTQIPVEMGDPEQEALMRGIATDILKVLQPLVNKGHVQVAQSPVGVSIAINAGVLFEPGQAILEKNSIEVLQAVAKVVAKIPNAVLIEGHTDNVVISTPAYPSNWELSTARACSVVRLFIENYVAPTRLTAIGYADQRPVASNATNEGRSRNRRVTLLIEPNTPNTNKSRMGDAPPYDDPLRELEGAN
ncbi:MAG: flagellar motor protein MotD [Pseudomonadota bacterium]